MAIYNHWLRGMRWALGAFGIKNSSGGTIVVKRGVCNSSKVVFNVDDGVLNSSGVEFKIT